MTQMDAGTASAAEQDVSAGATARSRDDATERAACTLSDGLKCNIQTAGVELSADMPQSVGGDGSAPTPGAYVRAGLASCLAILIKMSANEMKLQLGDVQVDVEMDFATAADAPTPAPVETRFQVRVEADADDAVLADLLERSLARDPFFRALRDPQSVRTTIAKA